MKLSILVSLVLLTASNTQAAALLRPVHDGGALEYIIAEGQVSFLQGNHQVTLPPTATCDLAIRALTGADTEAPCMVTVDGQPVEASRLVTEVIVLDGTSFDCGSLSFSFEKFTKPVQQSELGPLKKHIKNLFNGSGEYPYDSADIVGSTLEGDIKGYAGEFLAHHWGEVHEFMTYTESMPDTGDYHLNNGRIVTSSSPPLARESADEVRIVLAADWGAGTLESVYVAKLMMEGFDPHYTIHAGDVYYLGTANEVKANCLGEAPKGAKYGVTWPMGSIGSFALMGNHEMYSRGYGYFDTWLPKLGIKDTKTGVPAGQKASYSGLSNAYWRVINLDTGYKTYSKVYENSKNDMPKPLFEWLRDVVKIGDAGDNRGLVFISHHRYWSAWGDQPSVLTATQLSELVPANQTIVWLWGHEHRLSFYRLNKGLRGLPLSVYGRCIGNGGFPTTIDAQPARSRESDLEAYDDRMYEMDVGFKKVPVGFNGWTRMTFKKKALTLQYYSLTLGNDGNLSDTTSSYLVSERFEVDKSGSVSQTAFSILNENITTVTHITVAPFAAVE